MSTPSPVPGASAADGCAEARATVDARCAEAHAATAVHETAVERARELRRELVAAQHRLEEAAGDDPQMRAAEKAAARDTYQLARSMAETDDEAREAVASWAKALDRINRTASLRRRERAKAKAAVATVEEVLHASEREEQATKMRVDQAEAACLDARVRLAGCEEGTQSPESAPNADASEQQAASSGRAVAISRTPSGPPLVIESIVTGDRTALELAAARLAEFTGRSPAEEQLQLQELLDAVVSSAAEDGYLLFDQGHRFWSGLSFEEARNVIGALARLGFLFEPAEGWHAGRAPAPTDLSMALAYAGLDPRNMRDLPTAEELAALPTSIGVDARAFLAAQAPELTIDNVVRALGRRADALEQLWNAWGQVRPILLGERHALGSSSG